MHGLNELVLVDHICKNHFLSHQGASHLNQGVVDLQTYCVASPSSNIMLPYFRICTFGIHIYHKSPSVQQCWLQGSILAS